MRRIFIFILLGAAASTWAGEGGTGTPFLRVFDRDETSGSPVSWQVVVDARGEVYAGNNLGLLDYDGATWRRPKFSSPTLPPDALAVDARRRVWVAIGEAVDCFVPDADGKLERISVEARLPADARGYGSFRRAVARPEGVYFMAEKMVVLFREGGEVRVWRSGAALTAMWEMGGAVWVAVEGRGLARVEGEGALRPLVVAGAVPVVWAGVARGEGALLATANGPMAWAGPGRPVLTLGGPAGAAMFAAAPAVAGAVLRDGRMVFGTEKRGLVVTGAAGEFLLRVDEGDGLLSARVNGVAEDAAGAVWLALHNGMARVQLGLPYARLTGERGYRGSVRAVVRHAGRLYLGHAEGVSVEDEATGRARLLADIPANTNGAICFLPLGERLLVSVSGIREITADGRLKAVSPVTANTLVESRREPGAIFAGTPAKGVWLLRPTAEGGWRTEGPLVKAPPSVTMLLDTGDGWLWGATDYGLVWRADFRGGLRVDAPVEVFGPEQGAPKTELADYRRLYELGGAVGASSDKQILRFDAGAGKFVPEDRIAGLPEGRRPQIVVDAADGTLWAVAGNGTSRGAASRLLHVVPAGAGRWRAAQWPEGPMNWVTVNTLYPDPARALVWLSTQAGAMVADAAWTPGPAARGVWRPQIREVATPQQRVVFAGSWAGGAERTWTRAETALRFTYAAPEGVVDHAGRSHTLYRTRLDGLDAAWSPWTAETVATYTNLPGGRFVFRVEARDLSGRTSEEAALAFALPPPWWLTWWAQAAYAVAVGGVVLGAVRWRTRALQAKNERLEKIVAARTEDLRRQNGELARLHRLELDEKISARLGEEKAQLDVLRYQLNPHFLFNSLTSIRSQIPPASGSARATLDRLADFCRITLGGRPGDERTTVGEEIAMLRAYLDIEQTRMGELLSVEIAVEAGLDGVPLPRLLLLPLVENALKYGQATSEDSLGIRIAVRRATDETPTRSATGKENEAIVFEIANTGAWVERGARPGIPSLGIGHDNLQERLRRHYPEAHRFSHEVRDGWVLVRLELRAARGVARV